MTEQVMDVIAALRSPEGPQLREQMGQWVLETMPIEDLVPDVYGQWRPLVQEAMHFMLLWLSDSRLAPKLVEQMDLPEGTPTEVRLLRFIARVPGLQKLGQVLARNRHLQPSLRTALSALENSITDVKAEDIRAIIVEQLGSRLQTFAVEVEQDIVAEASVSAVMRFTWRNPERCERERGVFKVLKPYVSAYFAEDMELLQRLAEHLELNHDKYGFAAHVLSDTFSEVRQLMQHEVDFLREQATLLRAFDRYRSVAGVRIPRLIAPLCGPHITAMTEESGVKVTDAVDGISTWRREVVADQLIDTLIAIPLFAPDCKSMFHADPHAGNLLYDKSSGEAVILDWALTEQLTYGQRRHLVLLFVMVVLRDSAGVCHEIQAMCEDGFSDGNEWIIRDCVTHFIDQLPFTRLPGSMDAIDLMDRIALAGVPFPSPLFMFRKVLFTLEGIVHEIAGPSKNIDFTLARHGMQRWMGNWASFGSPLSLTDWLAVQSSMFLYGSRLWLQWVRVLSSESSAVSLYTERVTK